mmetsp:Transcript_6445/g.18450  ORF Transcript_6445/g.18450 Transcript_6445/m.18450 type:complete len:81 (-) Transcript_6445:69-311(-)
MRDAADDGAVDEKQTVDLGVVIADAVVELSPEVSLCVNSKLQGLWNRPPMDNATEHCRMSPHEDFDREEPRLKRLRAATW